ncbi:MAG: histidinol-phosphatase [Ignavibacteriae bacterium]|jgi:myo-inositol-1(or 4)-monophosphatase|nr:histidinol-phosphatase [Ignavibacteriota bacterium]NOG98528.1 histidinol-phosphatase [Ignavibacteriota bacterium]
MDKQELKEYKEFSKLLALKSAAVIKKYFRTNVNFERKNDKSPVTIADKRAEEIMREMIKKEFPDHGILGEEFGEDNPAAEYKWVLDPIDGTKSFICGAQSFGTLIALLKNGNPVLGVINQPILNEFLIGDGNTAELNGIPAKVRQCKNLEDAVLLTTDHFKVGKYHDQQKFDALVKKCFLYRNWGDAYGYYLVATGYADIMIDPIMSEWDKLALIPIIEGAGGKITNYSGGSPLEDESIIAAAPGVHAKVIEFLK